MLHYNLFNAVISWLFSLFRKGVDESENYLIIIDKFSDVST